MNIKKAVITDDITQLARTCKLTVVPTNLTDRPTAEFSFPQDYSTQTLTSIRPNGAVVSLNANYNGGVSHEIFKGNVEFMDDFTDADRYEFNADISQMPIGHPHRRKISYIFNNIEADFEALTNHKVLQKICDLAGIPLGRVDLPEVSVIGTLDIMNQSPVDVASMFCEPFNLFEFQHYFVRADQNGLQIILVDYGEGGVGSGPAYVISNAISVQKSYEAYMPDNRIGQADRFVSGASTTISVPEALQTRSLVHTFYSSSRSDSVIAKHSRWSETYTTMEITVEIDENTVLPEGTTLQGYLNAYDPTKKINGPAFGSPIVVDPDALENLQIKEAIVQKTDTYNYDDVVGLITSQHTHNTYAEQAFSQGSLYEQAVFKRVLTYSESVEYSYPGGAFGVSLERKWYHYSTSGDVESTTTDRYFGIRGKWILQDVIHDWNNNLDLTTASILFFGIDVGAAYRQSPKKAYDTAQKTKTRISRYQLYNGSPFGQSDLKASLPYSNKGLTTDSLNTQRVFTVNTPYMNEAGLYLIDALILRQKRTEERNPYWENVTIITPSDFTPVVGAPVVVAGAGGVCMGVTHDITEDSAVTTIKLRRLVSLLGEV